MRPGIRELTKGHEAGDILARIDLDPYSRSFRNVSTHILAPELSEAGLREALRDGHAYVSHDWMCDPTGFRFELIAASDRTPSAASVKSDRRTLMGDLVKFVPKVRLLAEFPAALPHSLEEKRHRSSPNNTETNMEYDVPGPGVYRVEGWLDLGGEERGWVYSNPIYVR